MTRMTKSLSLVLIGSSLILAGCPSPPPPPPPRMVAKQLDKDDWPEEPGKEKEEQRTGTTSRPSTGTTYYRHSTFVTPGTPRTAQFHAPAVAPSRPSTRTRTTGTSSGVSSSRPAGFGTTGHAVSS